MGDIEREGVNQGAQKINPAKLNLISINLYVTLSAFKIIKPIFTFTVMVVEGLKWT